MGNIKTTSIQGDLSVGRDLHLGRNIKVSGRSHFEGNVRIDGWLDAPNIKGAAKGLFADSNQLASAYPEPRPGWWALVGATLPAQLWVAELDPGDGMVRWVDTATQAGEINVAVELIADEIDTLGDRIDAEEAARTQGDDELHRRISGLGVELLELEERMVALSEEAYNEILAEGEIEEQVYYFIYED